MTNLRGGALHEVKAVKEFEKLTEDIAGGFASDELANRQRVSIDRDVFVRIQTDLLAVGDSIMTDRHHASNGNYEDDDPQNQIGGIIPTFPLSGWLRHGVEEVVHEFDGTACHPGEANANFMKEDVYERDLDNGYHEKGACADEPKKYDGCVVFDLFGGFGGIPGKVMRRPIKFNPVRSSVDYTRG